MVRQVFFSFDYDDIWVVNQIRNMGTFEKENQFLDHAEFEKLKRSDDKEIKIWIDKQMKGASVTCVLIG
ncbi:MAG: TIR domain-containing protein, partial [Chlamydiota bacterium]